MESVLISITAAAENGDKQSDVMRLITAGTIERQKDGYLLRYEETLDESEPSHHVCLTIAPDMVSMARTGTYETNLLFRRGQRYESLYHTPYGDMEMAIYCTKVFSRIDEKGGDVQLQYQLDMGGQFVAMHDFALQFMRKDTGNENA